MDSKLKISKVTDSMNQSNLKSLSSLINSPLIINAEIHISKKKLIHAGTGNVGVFVKEFRNYYGDAIIIQLKNGREFYAPKHEFKDLEL